MTGVIRRAGWVEPERGLNYAAIGATSTEAVLSYPPEGFRPAQSHHRIGSGASRFELAGRELMTWGALRRAGVIVRDIAAEPGRPDSGRVDPVRGEPSGQRGGGTSRARFLEDGTPWVTPGMTATLVVGGPRAPEAPVKVVWVVDEPGRIGFAYGSRPGHPLQTEHLLLLEHADDDSVWLTCRSIARPAGNRWLPSAIAYGRRQRDAERRMLTALHPVHTA
ncbi:DUF1990 family protein [uncultured Amnibacterium sp.]|uniref:DUF1990 family protein n=1 Tax=uncultured Amnibacterium sp. TaxID=1631851 RepID=UPI0035C9EAB3